MMHVMLAVVAICVSGGNQSGAALEGGIVMNTVEITVRGETFTITPLDPWDDAAFTFYPVTTQFSPVPSGKGWRGEEGPLAPEVLRDTVDNIIAHGFTGIEAHTGRPPEEEAYILAYAQSRGMFITAHTGALELFGRETPPDPSVYSPAYMPAVRDNAEQALAPLAAHPRLYNVFTYQDEPFHLGPASFDLGPEARAIFLALHGYELPDDIMTLRDDPAKWRQALNFCSDNLPAGWRQVYSAVKQINPNFKVVMTHDSHNTFGAGVGSNASLAVDDVFHWGGEFADIFVYDIYPYVAGDFRFGEPSTLPLPRMSQMHYSFAQMRNLTGAHGKEVGFWVGTYNPTWFKGWMGPEIAACDWSEREMSATAVANGANYLLTGYKIPVDAAHWESFGEGLRLIQKTGGALLHAPKVKARAAMLFPRTQFLQLQEEYFNVGLSFEVFLRAFGELDILHEEQVTGDALNGYEVLVLFDVSLLPRAVAERVAAFVRNGGTLIADCVPVHDEDRQPMTVMADLLGVTDAQTGRIRRSGHFENFRSKDPQWFFRDESVDESVFNTDTLPEKAGQEPTLTLVSPRPVTVTTAEVIEATASGAPGILRHKVGRGHTFLLGFCLQDTYFHCWKTDDDSGRARLRGILRGITDEAGIRARVFSSNPGIEATVRANTTEGFLFLINHESEEDMTTVTLADLPCPVARIVDLESGQPVATTLKDGAVEIEASVPWGTTRICRLSAGEAS
jgi:hypothetical protein